LPLDLATHLVVAFTLAPVLCLPCRLFSSPRYVSLLLLPRYAQLQVTPHCRGYAPTHGCCGWLVWLVYLYAVTHTRAQRVTRCAFGCLRLRTRFLLVAVTLYDALRLPVVAVTVVALLVGCGCYTYIHAVGVCAHTHAHVHAVAALLRTRTRIHCGCRLLRSFAVGSLLLLGYLRSRLHFAHLRLYALAFVFVYTYALRGLFAVARLYVAHTVYLHTVVTRLLF